MGISEELMDSGTWSVTLKDDVPDSVLADIDIRSNLWATLVITAVDMGPDVDDTYLPAARYAGVYLAQQDRRRTLTGKGLAWWLGESGDGGELYAGIDATTGSVDFGTQLANQVFTRGNGITAGSINANATAFTQNLTGGDTAREILDATCASAPGGPYFWRIDPTDFTLDADTQANLWGSTPGVILTQNGGRDGNIDGLTADLELDALNGEEVRTNVQVEWNETTPGTNNGTSSPTLPATYGNLANGNPIVRTLLHFSPKGRIPPVERWRKYFARSVTVVGRANAMASREANERSTIRAQVTAELPGVYDPWRFDIGPGSTVYLYDPDLDLTGTTAVQYRGESIYPTTGRVDQIDTPILDGYGVYLRCYTGTGSVFSWYHLTPHVEFEEGATTVKIGYRDRWPLGKVKPKRVNRRQRHRLRRQAHQNAQLKRFYDSLR
jgi:hypothetical protein